MNQEKINIFSEAIINPITRIGGRGCVGNVSKVLSATTGETSPGTVSDNVGNSAACPANQVANIDKTPPTCVATRSNTGTTSGVTATVTAGTIGASGVLSGTGVFTGVKTTTQYRIKNGAGVYRAYVSMPVALEYWSSNCSTYGNYSATNLINSNCTFYGSAGTGIEYVVIYHYVQWTCRCFGLPQPNCTWLTYAGDGIAASCPTACYNLGVPAGYNGCSRTSNAEWVGSGNICNKTRYNGTCTAWGAWSGWTNTVCTPVANVKQCTSGYN